MMQLRLLFVLCVLVGAISALHKHAPVVFSRSVQKYEAEDAHVIGGFKAISKHSLEGFSGTGFAQFAANEELNRIIFVANIPHDGEYAVTIRHASAAGSSLKVFANGHFFGVRALLPGIGLWAHQKEMITLRTGINSIIFENEGLAGDDLVNIDFIAIEGAAPLAERGATQSYYEVEAEDANHNGKVIGPDPVYTRLPSEASGRIAVQLTDKSQWIEFTLTAPANGFVLRYSIPDVPNGQGQYAWLSYAINGEVKGNISVNSHFSYSYGNYPFNKSPGSGTPHHFYDDARLLWASTLPAGTKVKLQGLTDGIVYTIDLADFYTVPAPYTQPDGFLSVVDSGADPSGMKDSTQAFTTAIQNAQQQNKGLWIPAGTFAVTTRFTVAKITIRGAGPWHTTVKATQNHGVGFFANWATNNNPPFQLYDFAILGDTNDRDDGAIDSGMGGAPTNVVVQNLWIEHTKCGMWLDGPSSGLSVIGVTIRNTFADGINLHIGFTNVVIQQSIFRNIGDDGIAGWSQNQADSKNTIKFNTIQNIILASGISLYGGSDNDVTDNIIADTLCEGSGIQVANRFGSIRLSGVTNLLRNSLWRTGGQSHDNASWNGAWWFWGQESPLDAQINVEDSESINSTYAGILFWGNSINNINWKNISIKNSGTYSIEAQGGFSGSSASFTNVVASDAKFAPFCNYANPQSGFMIKDGGGNSGWNSTSACRPPY